MPCWPRGVDPGHGLIPRELGARVGAGDGGRWVSGGVHPGAPRTIFVAVRPCRSSLTASTTIANGLTRGGKLSMNSNGQSVSHSSLP